MIQALIFLVVERPLLYLEVVCSVIVSFQLLTLVVVLGKFQIVIQVVFQALFVSELFVVNRT